MHNIPSLARRSLLLATATVSVWATVVGPALAADAYPSRAIKLIVPFPAGQGADASARMLANELENSLGQPVVIDNRPGANNLIGVRAVLSAPADGYTLFFGSNSAMAANAAYFKNLGYDPVKDFAPVAKLGRAPWVVAVAASSPIKTFDDLVQTSKKTPGGASFAVSATGYQLATILLAQATGMQLNIVPYKGSPQAMTDVIGEQVVATLSDYGTMRPLIEAGKLRPLLVNYDKRIPALPQIPTLIESHKDVPVLTSWTGLFARAGTPEPIVAKLTEAARKAVDSKAYKEFAAKNSSEGAYGGPAELAKLQHKEIELYRQAMKVGNVQPQ